MKISTVWAALSLIGGAPTAAAAADANSDCTRTVLAYADAWDHHDAAGFAALFTDDAVLDLGTGPARGRAAIADLFAKRNPAATTRHLMSNIVVTPQTARSAQGRSYLMLFAGAPNAVDGKPLEVDGFALVGEYQDRFSTTPQGCRIVERKLVTVFRRTRPTTGPTPAAAVAPPRP